MRRIIIESPYAGDVKRNEQYARECMLDSLRRGEAPFLSHLLYTQVLDDTDPEQRETGIEAGLAWQDQADAVIGYVDYGISPGMEIALKRAYDNGMIIELRMIHKGDGSKMSFKPCKHCDGKGCDKCNQTGFDVEVIKDEH